MCTYVSWGERYRQTSRSNLCTYTSRASFSLLLEQTKPTTHSLFCSFHFPFFIIPGISLHAWDYICAVAAAVIVLIVLSIGTQHTYSITTSHHPFHFKATYRYICVRLSVSIRMCACWGLDVRTIQQKGCRKNTLSNVDGEIESLWVSGWGTETKMWICFTLGIFVERAHGITISIPSKQCSYVH